MSLESLDLAAAGFVVESTKPSTPDEAFDPFAMVAELTGQPTVVTVLVEDPSAVEATVQTMPTNPDAPASVIVEIAPHQPVHQDLDQAEAYYKRLKKKTRSLRWSMAATGLLLANPISHLLMHPQHLFEGAHGLGHVGGAFSALDAHNDHKQQDVSKTIHPTTRSSAPPKTQSAARAHSSSGSGSNQELLGPILDVFAGFGGLENVIGGIFDLFPTNSWQAA